MSKDLATWLRERLDEDEQGAKAAANRMPPTWNPPGQARLDADRGDYVLSAGRGYEEEVFGQVWDVRDGPVVAHITQWDPARVLTEVQAKRRIIDVHESGPSSENEWPAACHHGRLQELGVMRWPCPTLRLLALPYASHPDYRAEWAPDTEVNRG